MGANLACVEWPGALATAEEADIETSRGPGTPVHRTTIWPVVEDGEVFVRSLNGDSGRWYREGTGDALVELVAAALSYDMSALSQDAQARQALVEIAAALATMNIPTALALQERIKQLR